MSFADPHVLVKDTQSGKTIVATVNWEYDTVYHFKDRMRRNLKLDLGDRDLYFDGNVLLDTTVLKSTGCDSNSTIFIGAHKGGGGSSGASSSLASLKPSSPPAVSGQARRRKSFEYQQYPPQQQQQVHQQQQQHPVQRMHSHPPMMPPQQQQQQPPPQQQQQQPPPQQQQMGYGYPHHQQPAQHAQHPPFQRVQTMPVQRHYQGNMRISVPPNNGRGHPGLPNMPMPGSPQSPMSPSSPNMLSPTSPRSPPSIPYGQQRHAAPRSNPHPKKTPPVSDDFNPFDELDADVGVQMRQQASHHRAASMESTGSNASSGKWRTWGPQMAPRSGAPGASPQQPRQQARPALTAGMFQDPGVASPPRQRAVQRQASHHSLGRSASQDSLVTRLREDVALEDAERGMAAARARHEVVEGDLQVQRLREELAKLKRERAAEVAKAEAVKAKREEDARALQAELDKEQSITDAAVAKVDEQRHEIEVRLDRMRARLAETEEARDRAVSEAEERLSKLRKTLGMTSSARDSVLYDQETSEAKHVAEVCALLRRAGIAAAVVEQLAADT